MRQAFRSGRQYFNHHFGSYPTFDHFKPKDIIDNDKVSEKHIDLTNDDAFGLESVDNGLSTNGNAADNTACKYVDIEKILRTSCNDKGGCYQFHRCGSDEYGFNLPFNENNCSTVSLINNSKI